MRTKRKILLALACSAASLLAACSGSSGGGKNALTFVSYGAGSYQNGQQSSWVEPFDKANGTNITIDSPSDNAKIKAMVQARNVTWDVVDTDPFFAATNCGTLLEKLDLSSLQNSFAPGTYNECGIPDAYFGLEMMYNTKTYQSDPPASLADFFNPKIKGQRIIMSADPTIGTLEAALLADGVAPQNLYPLDVQRALSVYDRIKSHLTLASTYGQEQQAMVGNQADMALIVSARAYSVLNAGGTFWKPVWDKIPVTWDVLVVPKGSPHLAMAKKFITYASQPAQSAAFAQAAGLGPANVNAQTTLNPLQQEVDAFSPAHAQQRVVVSAQWWTANLDSAVKQWSTWTSG